MISAHWYENGTYIQDAENPKQIYDMYGFPEELYQVKYPVRGCGELTEKVKELLGSTVTVNNEWGIDHGTWTTLVHVFPNADIPVVQLSVNKNISEQECFEIGRKLAPLREQGYLIMANGNVVHNLRLADWNNPGGTKKTQDFNANIISLVDDGKIDELIHYKNLEDWMYAVPTPDHYLPLLYALGAADGDEATVYNNICDLGTMAMTCFGFGM